MAFARCLAATAVAASLAAVAVGARAPQPARAVRSRVTALEIISRRPAFGGKSFGPSGQYEVLTGRARAVIDPRAPLNAVIVDLDKAPRNSAGLVEYSFDVLIVKPTDLAKGNHVLAYEFNNRGNPLVYGYFDEGGAGYEAANIGNAFLMNRGVTFVSSGWTPGTAPPSANPAPMFAQLPVAMANGRPLVDTAREEFIRDTAKSAVFKLTSPAATLDQTRAALTVRRNESDPREPVPPSRWKFVDDSTVEIAEAPGADAGLIYEFVYQARNSIVAGIGFAAMRDFVSFLRTSAADDAGRPNPLFVDGKPVLTAAVSTGTSQAGRLQRDFLYLGFNDGGSGRKVFDGMNPIVAGGRRTFVNYRFAQPGRWTRQHEDHLYPMSEFPFSYGTMTDSLSGRSDGLFRRCAASNTCPNVIQVDSDTEAYQSYASLVLSDTNGRDIELPAQVRYYALTTAHLQTNAGCRDAAHAVSPFPYYRAAFDALVKWVRDGAPPPPTKTASIAGGTFITVAEQRSQYPSIPNRPYNPTINELGVRAFRSVPPIESEKKYTQFVPRLDRDGNPVAGVVIPEVAAPTATLSGKAVRGAGFAEGELCTGNGSSLPFARTKAERLAAGDSRLSLEERYPGGHNEYAARYAGAVKQLVSDRYLLPEDGETLMTALARAPIAVPRAAAQDPEPKSASFERVCQPCHGTKGGGGIGPPLVPMMKGEREVLGIVREGRGQMPPISARDVTDAQVSEIVQYLKSLNKQ